MKKVIYIYITLDSPVMISIISKDITVNKLNYYLILLFNKNHRASSKTLLVSKGYLVNVIVTT